VSVSLRCGAVEQNFSNPRRTLKVFGQIQPSLHRIQFSYASSHLQTHYLRGRAGLAGRLSQMEVPIAVWRLFFLTVEPDDFP
jgi:hypothetical protein